MYVICTCMNLWGVAILGLEGHLDYNKVPDYTPWAVQRPIP